MRRIRKTRCERAAVELNFAVGPMRRIRNMAYESPRESTNAFCFVYCWKRRRSIKLPAQTHSHTLIESSAQHPLDFLAIFPIDAIFVFISAAAKALKFNLAGKLIIIAPPRTMWVQPVSQSVRPCEHASLLLAQGSTAVSPPSTLLLPPPSLRCVSHWAAAFKLFLCARLWR